MLTKTIKTFPRRQDWRNLRWYAIAPLLALLLFAVLMGAFLAYVHQTEKNQREQALYRDIESLQQLLKVRLRDNLDQLSLHAAELALPGGTGETGQGSLKDFLQSNPAITYLAWIDHERRIRMVFSNAGASPPNNRTVGEQLDDFAGFTAFKEAAQTRSATYSEPFIGTDNTMQTELHVPIVWQGHFEGTLVAAYSLLRSVQTLLPDKVATNYKLDLIDQGGNSLASTSTRSIHDLNMSYEVPLNPPGHGIRLRGYAFEVAKNLLDRSLLVAVAGLSLAIAASLLALSRYAAQRSVAEEERDRLFALSVDVLCILGERGDFLRVNPAFTQLFGALDTHPDLLSLAHPEDKSLVVLALDQATTPGRSSAVHLEARCHTGAQDYRWLSWSLRSERRGGSRSTIGKRLLYAVAHDVTERRLAEQALVAETRFRRAMEDSMLTGMRALDRHGKVTYVNRAFCTMLGYSEDELIGKYAPFPYWPKNAYQENQQNLSDVLAGKAPESGLEVEVQRRDGSTLQARMYVSPLIDAQGEQSGWMTSMTDITEPKRIREALAGAQERLTTVLDQFEAAVAVINMETAPPRLLLTNKVHRELFGEERLPWHLDMLAQACDQGTVEVPHLASHSWYELRPRSIRWVDGQAVTLLVATNITNLRANREIQRQQDEKLQQTSRLITMGEMASSLAHELNQPLTAIANYSMGSAARVRALQVGKEPVDANVLANELLDAMNKTARQAERAGQVIRRIREFVKRSEPNRQLCHPGEILADALGLAEIDAKRRSVSIEHSIAPRLPHLLADKILIEQVLLNLLKNAIESMSGTSERSLQLSIQQREKAIEFCVRDSGTGLNETDASRLFEPFYTTKRDGMGMGLNICRSIVESHQGRLWVESNAPQAGCTFKFLLPTETAMATRESINE